MYTCLCGVIYAELFVIYFDNNTDGTTMSCHKNKLTDSGFQPYCEIFDINGGVWNLILE